MSLENSIRSCSNPEGYAVLSHIRLQHLECFKDDDVRADDIFLKGAEETKTESETPDCTSAQEQIEILQLG